MIEPGPGRSPQAEQAPLPSHQPVEARWQALIRARLVSVLCVVRYVERPLAVATDVLAILLLVDIVVLISINVVLRKWFASGFNASIELAQMQLVWLTLIYLGRSYRRRTFIRLRAVFDRLPLRARYGVELIDRAAVLVFCGVLGWQGWVWTRFQYDLHRVSPTSLALPAWLIVAAIPVGCVLFAAAVVAHPAEVESGGTGTYAE